MNEDNGHRARLREKYCIGGPDGFLDYEILELLLTYAVPRKDVRPMAKKLIEEYHSLAGVVDAELCQLEETSGLGKNSAILIKLIRDLSVRYLRQTIDNEDFIEHAENFASYARLRLGGRTSEVMMVFYLNAKNMLLDVSTLGEGTTDAVGVYPDTIAKKALLKGARSVVLCHNHPGGISNPSQEDRRVTMEVKKALRILNIRLLDHLIVSKYDYFSFRDADRCGGSICDRVLDPYPPAEACEDDAEEKEL